MVPWISALIFCLATIFSGTLCAQNGTTYPTVTKHANALTNAPVEKLSENIFRVGKVMLDKKNHTLSFPAAINMSSNLIEFVCDSGDTKLHESLLRTEISPLHLHLAALLLSKPGSESTNGLPITISITSVGQTNTQPLEEFIQKKDPKTGKQTTMPKGNWLYTGWQGYGGRIPGEISGVVIALLGDSTALINSRDSDHENDQIWEVNAAVVPAVGTKVEVTIRFEKPAA